MQYSLTSGKANASCNWEKQISSIRFVKRTDSPDASKLSTQLSQESLLYPTRKYQRYRECQPMAFTTISTLSKQPVSSRCGRPNPDFFTEIQEQSQPGEAYITPVCDPLSGCECQHGNCEIGTRRWEADSNRALCSGCWPRSWGAPQHHSCATSHPMLLSTHLWSHKLSVLPNDQTK